MNINQPPSTMPQMDYPNNPEQNERQKARKGLFRLGNAIGFGFLAIAAVGVLVSIGLGVLLRRFPSLYPIIVAEDGVSYTKEFFSILNFFVYILGFGLAIFIARNLSKTPRKVAFPLRRVKPSILIASVPICLGAIVVGTYFTAVLSSGLAELTQFTPESPDFYRPDGLFFNLIYFASVAILPAIFEEFLCRGVILQALRPYGDNFALIFSSVIFGLMHGNLVQAPYAMVVGLVMGYFVLYTGSLWPGIIAHFINNGMVVVREWISTTTTVQQDYQLASVFNLVYIILGLAGILFLRKKQGSLFYVKRKKTALREWEKYFFILLSVGMVIYVIYAGYQIITNLVPA